MAITIPQLPDGPQSKMPTQTMVPNQSVLPGNETPELEVSSVSAQQLATPTPRVTVPEPVMPEPVPVAPVKSVADANNEIIAAQTEEARQLRERRKEQAALAGEGSLSDVFTEQMQDMGVPQNIRDLQDIQLQLTDLSTESLGRRSDIAREGGRTMRGAGLAVSAEQARNNVRSYGLAARASVLQGNVETAANLATQATQFAYQDRTLRNQNLQNQIQSLQSAVDDQTAQLLEKDRRQYEQDNLQMAQAVGAVNAAVSSGFASARDIEVMTSLAGDPQAQKQYADKIIAKAARTQYQMALARTAQAASAAAAGAQTAAAGAARENGVFVEKASNAIQTIRDNVLGVKASTGGTPLGRTALSVGFDRAKQGFLGGTAAGAIAGSVLPGGGTVTGGALGGVLGFGAGLTGGSVAAANQKTDVLSSLGFLVNSNTFSEMRRLKQAGVTFGSLTEGERKAIGASADALFSALEVDDSGQVTDVKVTEDQFYRLLDDYEARMFEYQNELVNQAGGLTPEDLAAIEAQQ